MPGRKQSNLLIRRLTESDYIVVAVAFGMVQAKQRAQREILLQG